MPTYIAHVTSARLGFSGVEAMEANFSQAQFGQAIFTLWQTGMILEEDKGSLWVIEIS